tara:strand:+ start:2337 stop:3029 length:693 start_codon:yes stop_codon:yes gene_type:complete
MTTAEQKLNELTNKLINEGIEDYIPAPVKQMWNQGYSLGKAAVMPELQGWKDNLQRIANVGLVSTIDKGFKRGAGPAAVAGALGGAQLAGGLASGGLINRPIQAFRSSIAKDLEAKDRGLKGGTAKSRIVKALAKGAGSLIGSGLRTAGAAGVGAGLGGVLGWKGGREAGAALAGAGALGGPAGLLVGPKSGAALGALGGLVASDLTKNMDAIRRQLAQGGGAGFFRDRN